MSAKQPARPVATSSTQAVFDVFGSYLVDVFYNGHYNLARERVRNGIAANITDDYRTHVLSFVKAPAVGVTYYKKLVMLWLEYYRRYAVGATLMLADFQDKILSQFIPPKFYADFSERQKDDAFRTIVIKTLTDFGDCVLAPDMLKRIIDGRADPLNVSLLQGRMDTILMNQRDVYYAQFTRKTIRTTGSGADSSQDRLAVEMLNAQLDKLKAAFLEEKRAHCALKDDHARAQNIIRALSARLADTTARVSGGIAHVEPPRAESPHAASSETSSEEDVPDASARRAAMLAGRTVTPPADNVDGPAHDQPGDDAPSNAASNTANESAEIRGLLDDDDLW